MAAEVPRPAGHDRAKPARPDARPMRAALGAGGLAALSALAAAIVAPPQPDAVILPAPTIVLPDQNADQAAAATPAPATPGAAATAERQIQYVQLQPGQVAPPGATVIPATAPTPVTVVVRVPGGGGGTSGGGTSGGGTSGGGTSATPKPAPKPTPIIIKTTQSGKVVP
jgi:hypothetical protein